MTEPGRDRLRVGHAERDAAAEALRDAAADGRITMEELDERLERALLARTYGELDVLFEDLGTAPTDAPRARADKLDLPGYSAEDPLVLSGGISTESRKGPWEIPPFIRINAGAGTVRLNCLQATAHAEVIDIELIGSMGTVVIVTPEGWAANTDRVNRSWGTSNNKIATTPAPGNPLLLLWGSVGMGTLSIRHANRFDRRKLEKAQEARQRRQLGGPS